MNSLEDPPEGVEENDDWWPRALWRTSFGDEEWGPTAFHYRLDVSFSGGILLPVGKDGQDEGLQGDRKGWKVPDVFNVLVELRFYDCLADK